MNSYEELKKKFKPGFFVSFKHYCMHTTKLLNYNSFNSSVL